MPRRDELRLISAPTVPWFTAKQNAIVRKLKKSFFAGAPPLAAGHSPIMVANGGRLMWLCGGDAARACI